MVDVSLLGGGLEHFLFFHILRRIIPTDFYIFQRGRYTTNQLLYILSMVNNLKTIYIKTGWWYTYPLKNMKVSLDYSSYIWKK
jgi:hypothetical protein